MPGDISRSNPGPRGGTPLVPSWVTHPDRWYGFPMAMGAEFSADRVHRFLLWRLWSPAPGALLGFVMLNPSSADETLDDPTTTRNCARARLLGYAGIVQANLYSFRTPSPKALKAAGYPGAVTGLSSANDDAVRRVFAVCKDVVLAWGAHARLEDAGRFIITANCLWRMQRAPVTRLLHLGRLKNGMPRHPLMTAYGEAPNYGLQEWA